MAPGKKIGKKPCENSRVLLVTGRDGEGLEVTGWQEREEGRGDSQRDQMRQGDKEGAGGGNQAPGPTTAPSLEAAGRSYNADPVGAVAGQTAASRIEAAARAREPAHRKLQPALLRRTERQSGVCEQTARRSPATGPRTWLVARMGMLMDEIKPQSFHDKLDFK